MSFRVGVEIPQFYDDIDMYPRSALVEPKILEKLSST